MDEEDAVGHVNFFGQAVRLLVVVGEVGAVSDYLEVFLLVDFDHSA